MKMNLKIALLLAFALTIFLTISFRPSLLDDADATHAQAAREMIERGDWVTLHVNGVRYLEKAPMLYWAVAISLKIFGYNSFAVRFPIVLAIILLGWLAWEFGRWAYSERAGFYAAAILVSCVGMFLFTRIMIPEALLTLWFTLAHYCFLRGFFSDDKRWYYGIYGAIALAVLTKGLIGIVFVAGPIGLFLLLSGKLFPELRHLKLVTGTLLFLAIAAPWHILAGIRNDRFFWFYFINEHVLRFLGKREPKDYNKVPFVFYWLMHLIWLFPWSLGIPLLGSQRPGLRGDRQRLINLYIWIWAGLILIFFNISTSQEYYTFPVYAPLALLLGAAFATAEQRPGAEKYLSIAQGAIAAVGLIAGGLLGWLVWKARNVTPTGDLSDLLDMAPADSEQYTLSLGHFFDLTTGAFAELRVPALGAALTLSIGFSLAWYFRHKRRHLQASGMMLLAMGLMFVWANLALQKFEPVLSSRALADVIERRWEPGARVVFNGEYETGSSIGFYTGRPIHLLNGKVTGMAFGSTYPDVPPVFLEDSDLERLWKGTERVFLFSEKGKLDRIRDLIPNASPLAEVGGKVVLTNRP